ncbi:aminoglycoside adenylyltransferase domain-containing protein [Paenisporosarcina quisquiliarum]|uniref:aminoglycoside adenylyltransferase domain-containing protein n=1 Tax=Paenisporosarcina quisquiliarum TaxID=365346 RepID=UPI0037353B53
MSVKQYLNEILEVFKDELHDNLVGVYLHGSLAMDCFNPNKSDVDVLVVCEREISNDIKMRIIKRLLEVTSGNPNQLEMSIILKKYVSTFVYPTPFELHYFHPRYLEDETYICGGPGFEDYDLAAHMMITYHRGRTLFGEEIKTIFKPIKREYYIHSIMNDIEDATQEVIKNPVYFTLNLCRVLLYLKEDKISSKKEGGLWGLKNLPSEFQTIVRETLDVYIGRTSETNLDNEELVRFANWMLKACYQLKSIRLEE